MLKPEFSGQFKRDYKLAIKRGCDPKKLEEVIDRMKATSSVSENYNSFTGDNNGMDSSVKFIYKINAVK